MAGRLLEALTSLCQAGERFVDSAAVSGRRMVRAGCPTEVRAQRPRMIQREPAMSGMSRTPGGTASGWSAKDSLGKEEEATSA